MDFLQQANHELEGTLQSSEETNAELKQQVQELSGKNSRICSELQEIGDLVKQMEAEKQGNEESLKTRIAQLEVGLFCSVFPFLHTTMYIYIQSHVHVHVQCVCNLCGIDTVK